MEKHKKKKKYYFPYKIFSVDRKNKSQGNIFEKDNRAINTLNSTTKKNVEINSFVKKLKSTVLSSKIFSKYMDNYIGQTQDFCFKAPGNTIYPLKKNYQYLPINFQKNESINLPFDDNQKDFENEINSVVEKPYGFKYKKTKIILNKDKEFYRQNSQEKMKSKIFMNFSEGNYHSNELLKEFGINNIDINNNIDVKKNNFDYLKESLVTIHSLQNFETTNSIEFKIKNHFNNEDVQFNMNIFSLCFKFYEIKEENEEKKSMKMLKKQKLYFPFKLMPFFYLLNYSYFKKFISEIIYFEQNIKTMNFNQDKFAQIFKKYSFYLRNTYQKNNDESIDDITFYRNEFVYHNIYDWIVINDNVNNKESIKYKMKISFPKVIFEEKNNKVKVINHLNKNILIRILKMNFIDWEKIVLFDLFSNKKFRYLINNILIGGKKYYQKTLKLYENNSFSSIASMLKTFNNFNKCYQNYEFFLSECSNKQSFYYSFIPNIILLLIGGKKKQFQKIFLNLKESRKLYELSRYWGAINTLFKCMYKEEMNNKIYFKLDILEDMPKELYKTIKKENSYYRDSLYHKNLILNSTSNSNKDKSNYLRYKSNEIELVLSECLLNIIHINFNEAKYIYYKVPQKLLNTVLTCDDNMKIVNCIIECYNEIINNKNVVDLVYEEKMICKKLNDHKRANSPTDKNKFERHLTIGQTFINTSKTFNKTKSFLTKNNKQNNFANSYGKQKSFMDNGYLNKLEKKNLYLKYESKNKNIISNFNDNNNNKNENEKLPLIGKINESLIKINNNDQLKKKRFSRNINKKY